MDDLNGPQQTSNGIVLGTDAQKTLLGIAGWTKYIGILGFIVLSLFLVVGILLGLFMPQMMESLGRSNPGASVGIKVALAFFIWVAISFYPVYALLKHTITIKLAIKNKDAIIFNRAMIYLKNMFMYVAIGMSLYVFFALVNVLLQLVM